MKHSIPISDELLSAYLDRQISEAELQRVEMALAAEPALQQRLDALQATVRLLQHTPSLVVPRAFVLSENQVLAAGGRVKGAKKPSFWEQWLPRLMPAATAFIAILFVFSFVYTPQQQEELSVATMAEATAAAPAARTMAEEESAPQVESMTAEKSGPAGRSMESKGAVAAESADDAGASAAEVTVMATGTNATAETEAAVETAPAESGETGAAPPEAGLPAPRFSWLTWLLGLLLILFLFLTWKLTLGRPRGE